MKNKKGFYEYVVLAHLNKSTEEYPDWETRVIREAKTLAESASDVEFDLIRELTEGELMEYGRENIQFIIRQFRD